MFSYSQHCSPYFHSDDYLVRDYLAQQQARERQAAQYKAQLEEARRRRLYQEQLARAKAMRRGNNNNMFMTGFESDTYEQPYNSFFQRPAPLQYPCPVHLREYPRVRRDSVENPVAQQMETGREMKRPQQKKERKASMRCSVPQSSSSSQSSPIMLESKVVEEKTPMTPPASPDLRVRDAAARTIQSFVRTHSRRLSALRGIEDISRRFEDLKANFQFPSTLDFAESTSYSESADNVPIPSLLYTPRNAPLHGHEHALVKLLSNLDAIESHGDLRVRRERKELVIRIEKELSALDEKKAEEAVAANRAKAMPVRESLETEKCGGSDWESGAMSLDLDSDLTEAEVDTDVMTALSSEGECEADLM